MCEPKTPFDSENENVGEGSFPNDTNESTSGEGSEKHGVDVSAWWEYHFSKEGEKDLDFKTFLDDEEGDGDVDGDNDSGQGTEQDSDDETREINYLEYIPLEVDSEEQGGELNEKGENDADGDNTASGGGGGISTPD